MAMAFLKCLRNVTLFLATQTYLRCMSGPENALLLFWEETVYIKRGEGTAA